MYKILVTTRMVNSAGSYEGGVACSIHTIVIEYDSRVAALLAIDKIISENQPEDVRQTAIALF